MLRSFFFILFVSCFAAFASAQPVTTGAGKVVVDVGLPIEVFTYKPANYSDGPLIVVFHGVNRNAEDYRNFAISMAERFGALVAAPLFDLERFPSEAYQRGGVTKKKKPQAREKWTFSLVPKIVEALRAAEGRPEMPYYFIGHSAGGQFVMRMVALAGAQGAERVVATNPGSHLFATRDADYGYGFGGLPPEWSDDAAIRRYLAAPLTIYLGTHDNDPNHSQLDRTAPAMRQGASRYQRGLNCFGYAKKLAELRGWEFNWRKVETQGVAHNSTKMFAAKEAKEALFGAGEE